MKVYKFGGGTLLSSENIQKMTDIVREQDSVFVVISAFNKMTNAFEKLVGQDNQDLFHDALAPIVTFHEDLIDRLFLYPSKVKEQVLDPLMRLVKETWHQILHLPYDQAYDQLVSYGELLSSHIVSAYWLECGLLHCFHDARDLIITDSHWRSARLNETETRRALKERMGKKTGVFLTQGFIGRSVDGWVTTLGREGSDYTAAIIGHMTDASEVVVWKDVPGILTADPAEVDTGSLMEEITYLEAVELSYFGAKILHPSTIKPLQNKGIPLIVKSLYDPQGAGTRVLAETVKRPDQPVMIRKGNQVLLSIQPRDFSFIFEDAIARVFHHLSVLGLRVNMMQHGAVSLSLVFDWDPEKLNQLTGALMPEFRVLYNTGLDLYTIRHYTQSSVKQITRGRKIYVQQKSRTTARFVLG